MRGSEPGPYGQLLVASGEHAYDNPFRFSTKYADDETGLVYYGYRYYAPGVGRWLSRDPIGERDTANLQLFAGNCPTVVHDAIGLAASTEDGGGGFIHWHVSLDTSMPNRQDRLGVINAFTHAVADPSGDCPRCCQKKGKWCRKSVFRRLRVDIDTTIYANSAGGQHGFTTDFMRRLAAFEGNWQAYFRRWYQVGIDSVRDANNQPCNENWLATDTRRDGRSCSAYQTCLARMIKHDFGRLESAVLDLDRRTPGPPSEYRPEGPWGTSPSSPQNRNSNAYLPVDFTPAGDLGYNWGPLSFAECDRHR